MNPSPSDLSPSDLSPEELAREYQRRSKAAFRAGEPELAGRFGALSGFLIEGLAKGASDIVMALGRGEELRRARFRIDGQLELSGQAQASESDLIESLRQIIAWAGEDPQKLFAQPIPFRAGWEWRGIKVAFRGQTEPFTSGVHVIFRALHSFDRQAFLAQLESEELGGELGASREGGAPLTKGRL